MPTNDQPQVITVLECLECGARDEAAEGWRAYLGPTGRASSSAPSAPGASSATDDDERERGGVLAEVAARRAHPSRPGARDGTPRSAASSNRSAPGLHAQLKIRTWAAPPERRRSRSRSPAGRAHCSGAWLPRRHDPRRHRLPRRQPRARPVLQRAALMLRIHADGLSDPREASRRSCRRCGEAGRTTCTTRAAAGALLRESSSPQPERDLGVVERSDSTGFNWADVPVVLVETGSSRTDEATLLRSASTSSGSRARSPARPRRLALDGGGYAFQGSAWPASTARRRRKRRRFAGSAPRAGRARPSPRPYRRGASPPPS